MKKDTLKSKTFIMGVLQLIGGIVLCLTGSVEEGTTMIGTGLSTIALRDAIAKATPPKSE